MKYLSLCLVILLAITACKKHTEVDPKSDLRIVMKTEGNDSAFYKYNQSGQLISVVSTSWGKIEYKYDNQGRVSETNADYNSYLISSYYKYNPANGYVAQVQSVGPQSTDTRTTDYFYDDNKQMTYYVHKDLGYTDSVTLTGYVNERPTYCSYYRRFGDATYELLLTYRYTYDANMNVIKQEYAKAGTNMVTDFEYVFDLTGKLVDPEKNTGVNVNVGLNAGQYINANSKDNDRDFKLGYKAYRDGIPTNYSIGECTHKNSRNYPLVLEVTNTDYNGGVEISKTVGQNYYKYEDK